MKNILAITIVIGLDVVPSGAGAHEPHECDGLPAAPALSGHVDQADIVDGSLSFDRVFEAGRQLFVAIFNICDGQGRPETTGTGVRRVPDEPDFIRTSAPDASSCADCHDQPRSGGSGGFIDNAFVLAQALDPVTFSVDAAISNERNTLGMFGSGAIEMLAREMTTDLQAQAAVLGDGTHVLTTKGVGFEITKAGGVVIAAAGVDPDLIVKPFHQAGVVGSLREFSVNAMNHHHGMQAVERFDPDPDHDRDGVVDELTIGDITAVTIFQAALGVPQRVQPSEPSERRAVRAGERLFEDIGCVDCHVPQMRLNSRMFVEPYQLNPPGTFGDIGQSVSFDLTERGEEPRLEKAPSGGAVVRAYTDLKRHDLCDAPGPGAIRFFCNERLAQERPDQDGRPGEEFFITRKLWDVGSSAAYGHRGDLTTIAEAILVHGGEGRAARDAFDELPHDDQAAVVTFLKTLQVVAPADTGDIRSAGSLAGAPGGAKLGVSTRRP